MSAEYPTKVTTQLRDGVARLKTVLTDDIAQGVAIIPVSATAGFPEKGVITIDNETKEYTGKTAFTFTGCSNINGTDTGHDSGAEVRCTISAAHINRLNEELIAVQTALGITGTFNFVKLTGAQTIAGVKTLSDTPKMDAIAEKTAATGVTIDGLLIKDGKAPALSSKSISASRDLTAASGNVSYTGVGFTPTAILAIGVIVNTTYFSMGFVDSLKAGKDILTNATNNFYIGSALLTIYSATSNYQTAILSSFDADGFTLTWTKTSSPTGTVELKFLCFR